jgi:proteasome accessory factor C
VSDHRHRIQRILTLIPYLRSHPGVRVEELEAFCGAPAAEILSDLNRILLCGVPPYLPDDYIGVYVDDGKVEIRFAEHWKRPVRFTLPEALALRLAIESLPAGGDAAYVEARRLLLEKISRILGAEAAEQGGGSRAEATRAVEGRLAAIAGKGPTHGLVPARSRVEAVLSAIVPALDARPRPKVEIDYYSASSDALRTRKVRPYGLVHKQGEDYLVAHDEASDETRSFRVDRIRAARAVPGETFEPPPRFSLERFERRDMNFQKRFVRRVKVRFDRSVARWVRESRTEDEIEPLPDGSLLVHMRVANTPWLLNEVLQYGAAAEIVDPPEMREAMRAHLDEAARAHAAFAAAAAAAAGRGA